MLVLQAEQLGISTGLAVRLSLLSAGVWWGGFAIITFTLLKSRPEKKNLPPGKSYISAGFAEISATVQRAAATAADGALPARIPDLQRRDSDSDLRVEHVSRTGAFSGRQSGFPAGDLFDGPVRCGGGRAPLRATRVSHQDEERDHRFARDLVRDRDLRVPVFQYRSGSVGDGGSDRDRARWIAGAVAIAVLDE